MKNSTHILYLTHNVSQEDTAESVNLRRRKEVLENLGFHVTNVSEQRSPIETFIKLLQSVGQSHMVIIRIDGTGSLDKYSLIKLIYPRTKIIWEIHGYPEESLNKTLLLRKKRAVTRKIFSFFSDAHIYISETLKIYSQRKVAIRPSMTIENFVTSTDIKLSMHIKKNSQAIINKKTWFVVFWGGNPNYPWHATNLLELVAKAINKYDPKILFITVGHNDSVPKWNKNIIHLAHMGRETYLSTINQCDLCIALYHTPKNIPTYFSPMKLLDYLLINKPFIVSDIASVRHYIHNKPAGILTNNSMTHIVQTIMKLKKNPSLQKIMIQNGNRLLTHDYSEKRASDQYKQFFKRIERDGGMLKSDSYYYDV